MAKKYFVLDTNVLLHDPSALMAFGDNEVVLPFEVIEELDGFKKGSDDTGQHARQVIRALDRLRGKGRLMEGVPIEETGGTLRVVLDDDVPDHALLRTGTADDRIIGVAHRLTQESKPTTFITKDINARIKSDALGIRTQDYEKHKVDFSHLYLGYRELQVDRPTLDRLEKDKAADPPADDFVPNEFAVLTDAADADRKVVARFDSHQGKLAALRFGTRTYQNVSARNPQQQMTVELLMLDEVRLVTLLGPAGTGKTLLAVACGMQKVLAEKKYEKLLVSRPVIPFGQDIGYLPGDKDEKLYQWMQPIFDNLAYILRTKKSGGDGGMDERIMALIESGTLELEALTYIRGRSIPDQFIIVDEAQNLTPREIKTVVSRIGEDSKLVLTGDPSQIDNPYLDSSSNGLVYAAERMKGLDLAGHVMLQTSERSELASLAAQRL
ncbi:MAG: phosphate starvation-inducible protein PhoH [Planctomycetes bacterium DG_20]|nr:MAG: phosphate starvation-inducible protein PhoH [Planctomycetes bacterium DG_20]